MIQAFLKLTVSSMTIMFNMITVTREDELTDKQSLHMLVIISLTCLV